MDPRYLGASLILLKLYPGQFIEVDETWGFTVYLLTVSVPPFRESRCVSSRLTITLKVDQSSRIGSMIRS